MSEFSSIGRDQSSWRSPRGIEEDIRLYQHKRFEDYMPMVDRGEPTRGLAIQAMRDEVEYTLFTVQPEPVEDVVKRQAEQQEGSL